MPVGSSKPVVGSGGLSELDRIPGQTVFLHLLMKVNLDPFADRHVKKKQHTKIEKKERLLKGSSTTMVPAIHSDWNKLEDGHWTCDLFNY